MDNSFPLIFRVFKFVIPAFTVIIFCTALCKCLQRKRQRQRQQAAVLACAQEPQSSVYIIPYSPSEEQPTSPPQHRYNTAEQYAPPPPYNELMAKDDFPREPPPAYTESDSSLFISSDPDRISPSCPTRRE
ncbi:hypothetical protein AMELA_G00029050 [Ameiurus melas]|uniref:Uncharacterized protein n=1 Tax=Ameiurus melas TaxID=219545 RepID=A0A7J6BHB4_AMEME|nr:hypothetical protein AMELA_G00029050 [Ameiurus melas]